MPPCITVTVKRFAWLQAGKQSPVFQFVLRRGLRLLVSCMGVNIRIRIPSRHIQRMWWKWFPSCLWHTPYLNWTLFIARQFCQSNWQENPSIFFSVRLRCKNYFHQIHILVCPTGKNRKGSDPANQKATAPCIFLFHQQYSTNNAQNCLKWELSHYITEKRHRHTFFPYRTCVKNAVPYLLCPFTVP